MYLKNISYQEIPTSEVIAQLVQQSNLSAVLDYLAIAVMSASYDYDEQDAREARNMVIAIEKLSQVCLEKGI